MKTILTFIVAGLITAACSLDKFPHDALSTSTFPKTEKDLEMLAIGCYDGYVDQNYTVYNDVFSDNGYCAINKNFSMYANGNATHENPGIGWFDYSIITRCNNFIEKAQSSNIKFTNPQRLNQLINEIRFIRAWRYYMMATAYGDIPLVTQTFPTLDEDKLSTTPEKEVVDFILNELDDISKERELDILPKESGRITRGAALALKMRTCLYYKKYEETITAADEIMKLKIYDL